MRKIKYSKKIMCLSLAIAMSLSVSLPAFAAEATNVSSRASYEVRKIRGDGVRLRREGHEGGAVLELMYNGEGINFYPDIYGTDTEYNYMQRHKTKTYGYVNHDFTM